MTRYSAPARSLALAFAAAALLAGCQMPGQMPPPQQTAALPPPAVPKPPPEARGIWIVGSPALRGAIDQAAAKYDGGPDTRPRLDARGTAAGFRAFCGGVGLDHPDMVASDRPIGAAEYQRCRTAGITLTEYVFGPKRFVYVKDSHMMAVPGVNDFVTSWGQTGKPVSAPSAGS
ncbi:substrate-binding domain-containing protein [Azospirillum lipoferum]|uniref:substrate-binding domain-containing protein n=1 Tax=Azospirillum lipoferum TaxID=193 RepID=UPI0005CA592A|nr:substrate-binding domain-containing protein [Azospirillum lipoferum]